MTTATKRTTRRTDVAVLLGAAGAASALGVALAVAGGLAEGGEASAGAVVGTLLAVGVFAFGLLTMQVVSDVLPAASLLVALLTYTLQLVVLALSFAVLTGSGLLDGTLDRAWLGAAVIACTAAWLVTQLVATMRRRIPVYELSTSPAQEEPARGRTPDRMPGGGS